MKTIQIKYDLFGFIPLKWDREYPESWSEVSPAQLVTVAKFYLTEEKNDDVTFLSGFFGIPRFIAKRLSPFMVYNIIDAIDFIRDFTPRESFIIKKLACGIPPKKGLDGLTFGRFIFIDTYFNEYAIEPDKIKADEALNKFIATLYWPGNKRFNENLIEQRTKAAAKTDPFVKQAVAINYRLIKDWLTDRYPLIFTKNIDDDKTKVSKKNSSWLKVFDSIVNDDIINSEKYAGMLLHDVLRYITRKIKENAKRS
jgi:hypothetical protein